MIAASVQQLAKVLCCHAWDAQQEQVAVCPNSTEVHIYRATPADTAWQRTDVLAGHDSLVTGLDWSQEGRLVSCSQDRSANVWQYDCTHQCWSRQRVRLCYQSAQGCLNSLDTHTQEDWGREHHGQSCCSAADSTTHLKTATT